MQRTIKTFLCAVMLAAGWQEARGYALLGPPTPMANTTGDNWETPSIGYNLPGDIGTPKNIGQGYRRNIPVMYYAFNENFSGYFGLQGEQAIDAAMAIMNNAFTNNARMSLDGYSSNLMEFPDDSQTINYTAEALGLTDLKSETLALMMEQMGLAEPERYTWTLHDRYLPPGGICPFDTEYLVVQRNFDDTISPLTQLQYSSYVNDTLYTYEIEEFCTGTPLALAVPVAVDPYANTYTAVAGLGNGLGETYVTAPDGFWASFEVGGFYTGLTRDDIAGLRYLMTTNNIAFEDPGFGTQYEDTNFTTLNPLATSDLATLLEFAQTNPPAAVQATFPGIVINNVTNYYTLVTNYNIVSYFTNYPGSPAGTPPTLIVKTNGFTRAFQEDFIYSFGNVIIVDEHSNTVAEEQTVTLSEPPGSPVGTPAVTNVTYKKIILTNVISGDYFLIPPGSCGFDRLLLASNNFAGATTNVITTATNAATGFVGSESIVTYFTNNLYEYYTCNFETSSPAFYQGIGHIQFVRVPDSNVDPLTGTFYIPITNSYSMVWWNPTNGQLGYRTFQRVVTQPDYLFSAEDLATPANGVGQIGVDLGLRNVNFDPNNVLPNLAGPGVINPPTTITFNEVGDIFGNGSLAANFFSTNSFLDQLTQGGLLAWGSFDATTNAPVVYPNGTSIQELENQLIITITPTSLPDGTNGVAYPVTDFNAMGGTPPYTWSLDGTQLPSGLAFFGGVLSGTPAGNPPGTYDFTVELTDEQGRTVSLAYSITLH